MKRPARGQRTTTSAAPRKRARRAASSTTTSDNTAPAPQLQTLWARLDSLLHFAETHFDSKLHSTQTAAWADAYSEFSSQFIWPDDQHKARVFRHIRAFVLQFVLRQRVALEGFSGASLVVEYLRLWKRALRFMAHLKRLLFHMHRVWLPQNLSSVPTDPVAPVYDLLHIFWRGHLLLRQAGFMDTVLSLINEHRQGRRVHENTIKGVLDNLVALGAQDCGLHDVELMDGSRALTFYINVFEELFLENTREFYESESRAIMASGSISTILNTIDKRIEEEHERCACLLHPLSVSVTRSVVEQKLIGDHIKYLQKQASDMFCVERTADLGVLVKLLGRIHGALGSVRRAFINHIVEQGKLILQPYTFNSTPIDNFENSIPLVDGLLKLHKYYMGMIKSCTPELQSFVDPVDMAFRMILNRPSQTRSIAIILAFYADRMLSGDMSTPTTKSPSAQNENVLAPQPALRASVSNPHVRVADSSKANAKGFGPTRTIPPTAPKAPFVARPRPLRRSPRFAKRAASHCDSESDEVSVAVAPAAPQQRVDDALGRHMDHVIRLFVYVEDKDLFCEHFRRFLAKRLLDPYNEVLVREFITKLQQVMGSAYAGKLIGMLNDIIRAKPIDLVCDIACPPRRKTRSKKALQPPHVDASFRVLNSMYWPKFASGTLVLPRAVASAENTLITCYKRKHPNRTLRLAHHQSRAIVDAHFGNRTYSIDMSIFQASAMLLFNNTPRLSLADLATQLQVEPEILAGYLDAFAIGCANPLLLRSVVAGERGDGDATDNEIESSWSENSETSHVAVTSRKTRNSSRKTEASSGPVTGNASEPGSALPLDLGLERKHKTDPGPAPEHVWYELNTDFCSASVEIKVDCRDVRSSSENASAVRRSLFVERKLQVSAAVVKALKVRKKLTFAALLSEVGELLAPSFVPGESMMKEQLQQLLNNEYVARDPECPDTYLYHA